VFSIASAEDVGELTRFSSELFANHGFDVDLSGGLDGGSAEGLGRAISDGFIDAIALPDGAWQHDHLDRLAGAFAGSEDWTAPYVDAEGAVPVGRPTGPYIVLLRPDAADDDDLRGLTAPALRKALGSDATLTIGEYLVVQRARFERHGDHRFDDYVGDPPGWMWLADSMVGDRTAMAYWNGAKRRVEVTACKTGSKNARKGARRCRVIPLA
jgi:hypothetical protein